MKTKLTENQIKNVLDLFYSESENTIKRISEITNLKEYHIHKIIDQDLKQKENNIKKNSCIKK